MSLEKADALVIRQVDFSESSRVVTFFSREYGKFAALAKGAKRVRGPFDAALDLLSECRLVFIRKSSGSLSLLTEARLIQRFRPQNSNPGALYAGYYVAELLNGLTAEYDVAESVYELSRQTLLQLMSDDVHVPSCLVHFEASLLLHIGLLPNLNECGVCGQTVELTGRYAHWVSQGGLLCADCQRDEYAGNSVSKESIHTLRHLTTEQTPDVSPQRLSDVGSRECHRLLVSAISQALGHRPKTLRYLTPYLSD